MSDHKMMIRADAKAMGAVTSLTTRVNDRWTPSKGRKSSECISIAADGTRTVFASKHERSTNVAGIKRRTSKRDHSATYLALLKLGAIGNTQ